MASTQCNIIRLHIQHVGLILQMLLSCIHWEHGIISGEGCCIQYTYKSEQNLRGAANCFDCWRVQLWGQSEGVNTFGLTKQQFRGVQPHVLEMERRWNKKESVKTLQQSIRWKQWQQINLVNLALNLKAFCQHLTFTSQRMVKKTALVYLNETRLQGSFVSDLSGKEESMTVSSKFVGC